MKRLKILAVDYAFPPIAMPRSIQVSRLLKHLDASVVVICGEDRFARSDLSIAPGIERELDMVFRISFDRSLALCGIDYIAGKLHIPWSHLPDIYRQWNRLAFRRFSDWQKTSGYRPDVLLTFGQPMSDHLFGLRYKKRSKVTWIAHFSDPWVDNPYHLQDPVTISLNRRMEYQVVNDADAVVFTSPETLDLVMKKYPSSWHRKAFYLPHCYDETVYDAQIKPPEDQYVIRSTGSLFGRRTPALLFEGVERIASEEPALLAKVVLELIGGIGPFDTHPYPLARKMIRFVGAVPYAESIQLMQTAHCLLVMDAPADFSVFFPSKLADYVGAGRFIIAISPPGATSRIVRELGGLVARPEVEEVVRLLRQVLKDRPAGLPSTNHCFKRETVSREMMRIIDTTIARGNTDPSIS